MPCLVSSVVGCLRQKELLQILLVSLKLQVYLLEKCDLSTSALQPQREAVSQDRATGS